MKEILVLLRPHQWLKNLFIFTPVFFNGRILEQDYFLPAIVMFLTYCLTASGIYCFNDIYDVEADRIHPKKRFRPIASGAVSKTVGYMMMVACIAISFMVVSCYDWPVESARMRIYGVLVFYVIMNIAYCVYLKQKPIVDVFIIAIGFVLRIFVGGFATGVMLSHWLVLMTFLLALFLAFAKRRDDVVMFEETGKIARKNIVRYNLSFMNQTIGIVASVTMVCYIMYTVSIEVMERFHSSYVYMTSIFVQAGIIRYLQVTIVDVRSGSPTKVLMHDRFIQACIICWILAFVLIIYHS